MTWRELFLRLKGNQYLSFTEEQLDMDVAIVLGGECYSGCEAKFEVAEVDDVLDAGSPYLNLDGSELS